MTISFTIPGKAVPQLRPRIVRKGKHSGLAEQETVKNYKSFVRLVAADHIKGINADWPTHSPIKIYLQFLFQSKRSWSKRKTEMALNGELTHTSKPDLDNLIKSITDALTGLVWNDDSQIYELHAEKRYSQQSAINVTIEIQECAQDRS